MRKWLKLLLILPITTMATIAVSCSLFGGADSRNAPVKPDPVTPGQGNENEPVKSVADGSEVIYFEPPKLEYIAPLFSIVPYANYVFGIDKLPQLDDNGKVKKGTFIPYADMKSKFDGVSTFLLSGEVYGKIATIYNDTLLQGNEKLKNTTVLQFFDNYMSMQSRLFGDEHMKQWQEELAARSIIKTGKLEDENPVASALVGRSAYDSALTTRLNSFLIDYAKYRSWMISLSADNFDFHFKSEAAKKMLNGLKDSVNDYLNILKSQWLLSTGDIFVDKYWKEVYTKVVTFVNDELSPLMAYNELNGIKNDDYTNGIHDTAMAARARNALADATLAIKDSSAWTESSLNVWKTSYFNKFKTKFGWNFSL